MTFPIINHINEVLPAIKGFDEFKVTEKENYTVINYYYATEKTFLDPYEDGITEQESLYRKLRLECRGLIFDTDGNLIRRPFHKFFNLNEKSFTSIDNLNIDEVAYITEKYDGSMIAAFPIKDGFRLGTKSGITDISMQAEYFIADKQEYITFIQHELSHGHTPIFEWTSRKNRIVLDYPEDNLALLAVRNNQTGEYLSHTWMNDFISLNEGMIGIPVCQKHDYNHKNFDSIIEEVNSTDNTEGIVLTFNDGNKIKIKADEYVRIHKVKSYFSSEKDIINLVIDGNVDDVVSILPKPDRERLLKFQEKFFYNLKQTSIYINSLYEEAEDIQDQKEYAVEFVKKQNSKYHSILFAMRKNPNPMYIMEEMIRRSLNSSARIDEVRWMFGDIHWNG